MSLTDQMTSLSFPHYLQTLASSLLASDTRCWGEVTVKHGKFPRRDLSSLVCSTSVANLSLFDFDTWVIWSFSLAEKVLTVLQWPAELVGNRQALDSGIILLS